MANFTKQQLQNQIMNELIRTGTPENVARSAAIHGVENYGVGQDIEKCIDWARKYIKPLKHIPGKPAQKRQARGGR